MSNAVFTVSWPPPTTGWVLETASVLSSNAADWTAVVTSSYQTNLAGSFVNVTNPAGNVFYRLRQQR